MAGNSYDSFCFECGIFIPRDTTVVNAFEVQFCSDACFENYRNNQIGNQCISSLNAETNCFVCNRSIPENHKYIAYGDGAICSAKCYRKHFKTTDSSENSGNKAERPARSRPEPVEEKSEIFEGKVFFEYKPNAYYNCYGCRKMFKWEGNKYQVYWNPKKSIHHIFCSVEHRDQYLYAPALSRALTDFSHKFHKKTDEVSRNLQESGAEFGEKVNDKITKGGFAKWLTDLYSKMGIIPPEEERNKEDSTSPTAADLLKKQMGGAGSILKGTFGKKKDE